MPFKAARIQFRSFLPRFYSKEETRQSMIMETLVSLVMDLRARPKKDSSGKHIHFIPRAAHRGKAQRRHHYNSRTSHKSKSISGGNRPDEGIGMAAEAS
jgi:hypothetical protein